MIKKLLLVNAFLAFAVLSFAQTVNVTFEVNAANITVDAAGLHIAGGGTYGDPGDNPMTDTDGDGIWTVTIEIAEGTSSYWTILNGGSDWGQKENIAGLPCANSDNFNDRWHAKVMQDTTIKTCFAQCSTDGSCSEIGEQIDLPISWDEEGVDFNLNTFDGSAAAVVESPTDADNMVLEIKKPSTAQTWAGVILGDEGFASDMPFDADNNNVTVRFWSPKSGMPVMLKIENADDGAVFVETQATTSEDGDWEDLVFDFTNPGPNTNPINYANTYNKMVIFPNFLQDAAGTDYTFYVDDIQFGDEIVQAESYDITFNVDMNNYDGSYTNVNLNGTFNSWCGDCTAMSDEDGDGVYSVTVNFPDTGEQDFKFTVDGWTDQEQWDVEGNPECTKVYGGTFVNRFINVQESATLPVYCWNECGECGAAPVDVTFQVDMNAFEGDAYSKVNLNGTFNGWCGECTEMTDEDGDGVYEVTIELTPQDTVEYKFTLDGWGQQEEFGDGTGYECTSTIDGFTNRSLAVGDEDGALDVVCYNSCEACPSGFGELNGNTFSVSPNPSTGFFNLTFDNEVDGDVVIYNYQGKVVYQNLSNTLNQSIDLSNEPAGIYLIKVMNGNSVGFSQVIIE
ncbi:MAG: T9SS type A sorting domain-containing protein [Bacteroidia bacterium]